MTIYRGGSVDELELKQMLENHIRDQTQKWDEQARLTRELLERTARVETLLQSCPGCQVEIREQGKAIVKAAESAKSAHRRLNGIKTTVSIVALIVSTVIGAIFTVLNFIFRGHG
ncbi:MAG: hypothetical protein ABFC84_02540 [Veillonellales bacterium]